MDLQKRIALLSARYGAKSGAKRPVGNTAAKGNTKKEGILSSANFSKNFNTATAEAMALSSAATPLNAGTKRAVVNANVAPRPTPANAGVKRVVVNANVGPRIAGIVGFCPLINVGNSCYMNATMQLLVNIPELFTFFTRLTDAQIADSCVQVTGCTEANKQEVRTALKLMQIFFTNMRASADSGTPLKITDLNGIAGENLYLEILELVGPMFEAGRQADAAMFLQTLFAKLLCSDLFKEIQKLFTFQTYKKLMCESEDLNPQFTTVFPEQMIGIDLTKAAVTSVQTGIDTALSPFAPDPYSNMHEKCATEKYAMDTNGTLERNNKGSLEAAMGLMTSIQDAVTLPDELKYLFLTVGRSVIVRGASQKNHKQISIDPVIRVNGIQFKIKMAICQLGSDEGGHYIAYNFKPNGEPHMEFDDPRINPVASPSTYFSKWATASGAYNPRFGTRGVRGKLIEQTCTILLYERVNPAAVAVAANAAPRNAGVALPPAPKPANSGPAPLNYPFDVDMVNAMLVTGARASEIARQMNVPIKEIAKYIREKRLAKGGRQTRKQKQSKKRRTHRLYKVE